MAFKILVVPAARAEYVRLKADASQRARFRAVRKTVRLLSENPRHPGLRTHEYVSLHGPGGEKVFEAYAQQNTPAAYRVFWFYGPALDEITIFAITPHP